jgi:hypothetical protein
MREYDDTAILRNGNNLPAYTADETQTVLSSTPLTTRISRNMQPCEHMYSVNRLQTTLPYNAIFSGNRAFRLLKTGVPYLL